MVRSVLLVLSLILMSCNWFEELEVRLYVEGSYTSLGDDYVTIRYDYTPGYNTIAKLDLYEYDPSSSFTDYIKSYSLAPGVNRDLALEDADFRLHPSGDFKGFRLDVIPLQSRAGEESPFNFYSGESYFFRIDRRTSDTTFGGFFVENMVQSQFFLGQFSRIRLGQKARTGVLQDQRR
jgi:hypothetical protein